MLKVRILTSIIGLPLLAAAIILGGIPFSVVVFIISAIAMHEFLTAFGKSDHKPLKAIGYLGCLPVAVIGLRADMTVKLQVVLFFYVLLVIASFLIILFKRDSYDFIGLSITAASVLYIPLMFIFLVLIRNMQDGGVFIWFVFIGAWTTDTIAYFAGRRFGKHKLMPLVSPNKTVEGAVAGLAAAVFFTTLYGFLAYYRINILHFAAIGVICGIVSQLGDLAASSVKRFTGFKDYGGILPGHGGIMDRFDSVTFIAPLIYFYLRVFLII